MIGIGRTIGFRAILEVPSKCRNKATAHSRRPPAMFERLRQGIARTRDTLSRKLKKVLGRNRLDAASRDELESILLGADVGVTVTHEILHGLAAAGASDMLECVKQEMRRILLPCEALPSAAETAKPYVTLVVGVNGAGKTTSIAKLAARLKQDGKQVVLAAGDTFRAAAIDQLLRWGERLDVPVIAQQPGADSASVIFDAYTAARARNADHLIADTAGRLHTKEHLMNELRKVKRVLGKQDARAPHETMMIIDATTGQNAISQVRTFLEAVGVDSLVITKLDGTAKGGVILALAREFGLPIPYIGVGEGVEDLQPFDARAFVDALFPDEPAQAAELAG